RCHWYLVHAVAWMPGCRGLTRLVAPLVTTPHGADLRLAHDVPTAARLFRYVVRRSAVVTTVSRWLAQGTAALVPDVRPVVAPMPIKGDLFHPGGARPPARLLFVGTLNEQKGVGHVLRALARVRGPATLDVDWGVGGG